METRSVQVWLKPDLAGAERFAMAVSTPGSAQFHQYLSPNEYTARFGPTPAAAKAVADRLTAAGLSDVQVSGGRDYVSATGPVSNVPSELGAEVLAVTGLSTGRRALAAAASGKKTPQCSQYWAEHMQSFKPAYKGLTTAALPICGYSAKQLRAAYGASRAFSGRGQTVALTELQFGTSMQKTMQEWAKRNNLPPLKRGQYREQTVGRPCPTASTRSATRYDDETEMDSQAVYAMAPDAKQLVVVGNGCNEDEGLLNAVHGVLLGDGHRPSATIVSNSWGIPGDGETGKTLHALTLRAAAEGVGLYFASGDAPTLDAVGEQPFATAVGGTTLGLGAHNERVFETGWSNNTVSLDDGKWNDLGGGSAAGGGTSLTFAQPAYQKGVVPASMSHVRVHGKTHVNRASPDISAIADPNTGMLVGHSDDDGHYVTQSTAGTSLATPVIAGLIAGAQQGRRTSYGFINPVLYRLHGTPAIRDVLPLGPKTPQQNRVAYTPATADYTPSLEYFDYQGPGTLVTAKGYDTTTGIGTPNGLHFLLGLHLAAK
ncbi:S53 family peptidase [Kribbella antibiotica]|uniref:S53 family peptidase n=1 Tax=Kribbella antibiotica TaxID=190195 RepID=UPI00192DD40F|nr:protease pro-enzyme activation domain-containing protein [Kribbella antibiotica]